VGRRRSYRRRTSGKLTGSSVVGAVARRSIRDAADADRRADEDGQQAECGQVVVGCDASGRDAECVHHRGSR
jgi:hypothetical protein